MNDDIKAYAKESNVKLWQIADELGMRDTNFSKLLRHPLSRTMENRIVEIIDKIAESRKDDENE